MRARYIKNPHIANFSRTLELDKRAMEDVLDVCGVVFRQAERKLFRTEGESGGSRWKALSPAYAAYKTRFLKGALKELRRETAAVNKLTGKSRRTPGLKTVNKILQLSGDMRDSFISRAHPDHIETTYRLRTSVWKVQLGSQHRLAKYHASGREHNPGLPVREPVQVSDADVVTYRRRIWRAFVPHVTRRIRAFAQLKFAARAS